MTLGLMIALCAVGATAVATGITAAAKTAKENNAAPVAVENIAATDNVDTAETAKDAAPETVEDAAVDAAETEIAREDVESATVSADDETQQTQAEEQTETAEQADSVENVEEIIIAEETALPEIKAEEPEISGETVYKAPVPVSVPEQDLSIIDLSAEKQKEYEIVKFINGEPAVIVGDYNRFNDGDFLFMKEKIIKDPAVPYGNARIDANALKAGMLDGEPIVKICATDELFYNDGLKDGVIVKKDAHIPVKPQVKEEPLKPIKQPISAVNSAPVKLSPFDNNSFGERLPFKDKILGADKAVKQYYNELNNEFLSYKKVSARVSVACASYRLGRDLLAKITYRGKTMKLNLALKVKDYDENVYHQKDTGDVKAYEEVPFTVKVKSDRGVKYALALIKDVCEKFGSVKKADYKPINSIKALKEIK